MEDLEKEINMINTNITAVHQWIDELIDKTDLDASQIAEYTGENKTIKPVTVATYQILTWRPDKNGPYPHFSLFRQNNWGLVIYDEVHMIPAPVFRVAAELQAVRRVGLTATLVREDGCEGNVFSLVGPKRYDVPWKELEKAKWIAKAECIEVRLDLNEDAGEHNACHGGDALEHSGGDIHNSVLFVVIDSLFGDNDISLVHLNGGTVSGFGAGFLHLTLVFLCYGCVYQAVVDKFRCLFRSSGFSGHGTHTQACNQRGRYHEVA